MPRGIVPLSRTRKNRDRVIVLGSVYLALALFVAWVFTNDHDDTVTTNDFALVAHWLN